MITVRYGGNVYGPGVFMFEDEAIQVKEELLARGTKLSKHLAGEIGMPGDGVIHSGEILDVKKMLAALRSIELRIRLLNKDGMIEPTVKWLDEMRLIALDALGRKD